MGGGQGSGLSTELGDKLYDGHGAEILLKYSYCIGRIINSFLSLFISLFRIQIQSYCPCLVMVLHLSYRWGRAPAKLLSGEEEVIPQNTQTMVFLGRDN